MNNLEWALEYARRGWHVLPLYPVVNGRCTCPDRVYKVGPPEKWKCSPGKHPYANLIHGVKDATIDVARVAMWWSEQMWRDAGVGIALGPSRLLDIAPDGIDDLADFLARGLPETLTFRSGGGEGHQHYLYRLPDGVPQARLCLPKHYDIMSDGYCVAPPTQHASGGQYRWDNYDTVTETPLPPTWACALLAEHVEGRTPAATLSVPGAAILGMSGEPPLEIDQRVWAGLDLKDRSGLLWQIAGELAQAGANEATIVEALRERDVTLGLNKYTGRKDQEKRYHETAQRQLANTLPRIHINVRLSVQATTPADFLTAPQLAAMEDEHIMWFAHGRVGAGLITELDGKAKLAGKTTLALDLVHAVVHGEEFLGEATAYTPVVYLTEQSGPSFKRNLSRAGLLDREDIHILLWNRVVGVKWNEIVAQSRAYAAQVGAGMLVVDTLAQFSGIRGDDENKSGAAMQTMEPLHAATADGLAVVVSRHDRKSGGDVGDSGRGSSAYAGAVDIILHLERLPGENPGKERQRLLDAVSRFEETPDKKLIEFLPGENGERSEFRILGDPGRLRSESLRIDILASLPTSRDDAPTFDELRKELGMREIEVRRALNDLVAERLVEFFDRPRRYFQKVFDDGEI